MPTIETKAMTHAERLLIEDMLANEQMPSDARPARAGVPAVLTWPLTFSFAPDVSVEGDKHSFAVFSADRRYRYLLGRMCDDYFQDGPPSERDSTRPVLVVGMQNPSKADAFAPDHTITKLLGFRDRLKCGGLLVVNGGAYIATDPRELLNVVDPIGPHNKDFIAWAFHAPLLGMRVGAWGHVTPRVRRRMLAGFSAMKQYGARWCWGKTKDGEPRHPLMLAYDTPLVSMADGRPFP